MKIKLSNIVKEVVHTFMNYPVTRSAAALSYYLTLSAFPFLICVSIILGVLNIQDTDAFALLEGIIPDAAFIMISDFFGQVSDRSSEVLFLFAVAAMLTSSSAAFRTFIGITGDIQGKMRFSGIMGITISFIFSILFLVAIYGSALIVLSGAWLMQFLDFHFHISELTTIWGWIRFILLFLLFFAVIFSIYIISAPKHTTAMSRLPGALAAAIVVVGTSILFSQLITFSLRYELLYGSLASFIILMVWLYICSIILIVANVINISVSKVIDNEVRDSEELPVSGEE
ncbi:MAG: YihY/virulence factor BrkB family protein [Oscillospiraceae bacterium]|nr:YihY/virulence factor BrkB family protein [Oscillospiraceae bacterium]